MGDVPVRYIFGAIIPGTMIAVLFFFEHNVASKMAQQKEFNLKHPSAYHYDVFLLGIMVSVITLIIYIVICSYNLLNSSLIFLL